LKFHEFAKKAEIGNGPFSRKNESLSYLVSSLY
jgi:hypothetical protein